MRRQAAVAAVVVYVVQLVLQVGAAPHVRLTTSYCPTVFTGRGAVVDVPPRANGTFSVVSRDWTWPDSQGVGCPEDLDPNVGVLSGSVLLDFTSNWGFIVQIDAAGSGNVTRAVQASKTQLLFDGFISWATTASSLIGVTPAAAQHGFCSDGCLQFGVETWPAGEYSGLTLLPFKAAMTNVAHLDESSNMFYFQASHPVGNTAWACSSNAADQCLVAIDATKGSIVSSQGPSGYTVYSFGATNADGSVHAFVFGFESECQHPYNNFAFATIDLKSGKATLVACVAKDVVIDTDPTVGAFSPDGTLFATGSGNSETGVVQLVVLDPTTGEAVLNSSLPGLKKSLGVSNVAPFINVWGVSWTE